MKTEDKNTILDFVQSLIPAMENIEQMTDYITGKPYFVGTLKDGTNRKARFEISGKITQISKAPKSEKEVSE